MTSSAHHDQQHLTHRASRCARASRVAIAFMRKTCSPTLRTGTTPMRALVMKTSSARASSAAAIGAYLGIGKPERRRIRAARCRASRPPLPHDPRGGVTMTPPLTMNTLLIVPPTHLARRRRAAVLRSSPRAERFARRKHVFEPVEMLEARERGIRGDRQSRDAQVDTPSRTRVVGAAREHSHHATRYRVARAARSRGGPLPRVTMSLSNARARAPRPLRAAISTRKAASTDERDAQSQRSHAPDAQDAHRESARVRADEHGLEQAVAVLQAAIVERARRHRGRRRPSCRGCRSWDGHSKARSRPRALARVSSSSRSGTESATMPPPARNSTCGAVDRQRADQDVEVGVAVHA